MGKLCLSSSELAESFSDGHGLDTTSQMLVERWWPSGDFDDILPFGGYLVSSHKAMIFNFLHNFKNFVNFAIIYSFDIGEFFFRRHDDAGNGAKAMCFEFGNISSIDAIFLQLFNLVKIGLLKLCVL